MTNKEIKLKLQIPNVEFEIVNIFGNIQRFKTRSTNDEVTTSIFSGYGDGMNVEKFGSKRVYLYTFDMLNKRSKGHIDYSNITFIEA